ncbi:ABC transporter ATP-binding protein [Treponema saccharophilum]|uniref:Amino acid/amide ABC transporter ATP-binding protein 1, HAAT family n=1 Tax=Treponema saccharophilum DSM 2985 TaxID=907348 RepID=H7EHG2_9SPIR|nr:ABC transporter ATP-binding protein [Treponema saccharophilum]EIC02974.1 amino acid/amide ABC transporter ATP-binding protein 1, HAAT family [Treponema saccharophilum DSM 2985]BDC96581.1 ABC transporter ATP-binding protein [Treponema saccharophilum]
MSSSASTNDMKTSVLRMEHVTMQFGGVVAVNDLSLSIRKNEIVSLIGPNGAGKTTAFNVVTGVYAPTNGCVFFDGKKIIENHPHGKMKKLYAGDAGMIFRGRIEPTPDKITKAGIARTFQNIRLWKSQSVFDNVLIAKHLRRTSNVFSATFRLNRAEELRQRKETAELLEILGLSDVADEKCTSLPYGRQRRLEIARALATEPKLLLLDEPAAGMNPQETAELTEFIHRIRDEFNLTILMIEHHMELVMDISDRIYVLNFGALIAEGTPEEVQKNPAVIAAYLGEESDA